MHIPLLKIGKRNVWFYHWLIKPSHTCMLVSCPEGGESLLMQMHNDIWSNKGVYCKTENIDVENIEILSCFPHTHCTPLLSSMRRWRCLLTQNNSLLLSMWCILSQSKWNRRILLGSWRTFLLSPPLFPFPHLLCPLHYLPSLPLNAKWPRAFNRPKSYWQPSDNHKENQLKDKVKSRKTQWKSGEKNTHTHLWWHCWLVRSILTWKPLTGRIFSVTWTNNLFTATLSWISTCKQKQLNWYCLLQTKVFFSSTALSFQSLYYKFF